MENTVTVPASHIDTISIRTVVIEAEIGSVIISEEVEIEQVYDGCEA